jgi:hypothetical protein
MPAYAYKAHINYSRLKVRIDCKRIFDNGDWKLTIRDIAPYVGENPFEVENCQSGDCIVTWTETRDETDDEYNARINKLEKYNAEVDNRNAAKGVK